MQENIYDIEDYINGSNGETIGRYIVNCLDNYLETFTETEGSNVNSLIQESRDFIRYILEKREKKY